MNGLGRLFRRDRTEEDLAVRIATDFRGNRSEWVLGKSGLFAKDNHQEDAIPVMLTLLKLLGVLDMGNFMYSTSLDFRFANVTFETDLLAIAQGPRQQMELAIGECKDEHGLITEKDVTNLRLAWKQFEKSKVACHLIFAKTTESFSPDELRLFHDLQSERIPTILLTNRELEPDFLSEAPSHPRRYAASLSDIARDSASDYLAGDRDAAR